MYNEISKLAVAPALRHRSMHVPQQKRRWLKILLLIPFLMISLVVSEANSAGWHAVTPILTARDQFTGGVINGKIYVFGGNGDPNGLNLKSTEVFDPLSNQWSYLATNEHNGGNGVEELTGAVVNGKLYVFGGYSGGTPYGVFNFVEEYNPATNAWASKAPMPTTRSSATAVAYNGEIYLFGGYLPGNIGGTPVVEAYNPATNTWRSVTNIPVNNLEGSAVTVVGDKAYIIGGYNGSSMVSTVMTYNFVTNSWMTTGYAPVPTPRVFPYAAAAPVIDGKIFLIGGIIGNKTSYNGTSVIEIYDTATNTWSTDPSFPSPLYGHLSVVMSGAIYVVGGDTGHSANDNFRTRNVWTRQIQRKSDVNGDGSVNLTDVVLALQVVGGLNPGGIRANYEGSGNDIGNDGNVGLKEAIYSLQGSAGLRSDPFDISGWWDLYVPVIQSRKVDAYFFRQDGAIFSGTNILNQPSSGTIAGGSINMNFPQGGAINGTVSGDTITGGGFMEGKGNFTISLIRSTFHFTNFYPGESLTTTSPAFSWTTSTGAEKYYIQITRDNAQSNCHEVGGCAYVWAIDGVVGTSVGFNSDGKAALPLVPGNTYRIRVYSRYNAQTGTPNWNDANTFIDTTMDVAFKIAEYSNASMSGVWITSQGEGYNYPVYFTTNGNGTITDMGAINLKNPPGTYTVSQDGSVAMTINTSSGGIISGSGILISLVSGTSTFGTSVVTMSKVIDLSALQGRYSGTMSKDGSTYNILFTVDSSGSITNFASTIPGVSTASGKAYAVDGSAVIMIRTNAPSPYDQIHAWGTLSNGQLAGFFEKNAGPSTGTFTLTRTTVYSSADLQGTWRYKSIVSGNPSAGQLPGSLYGTMSIDSAGKVTSTPVIDSAGTPSYTPALGTLSIDSNGKIAPGLGNGSWIMTPAKDAMLLVGTGALGSMNGVRGYNLMIAVKAGSGFQMSDLTGTWIMNVLSSGGVASQNGWAYGTLTIGANGDSSASYFNSNGQQFTESWATIAVDSSGIVTVVPNPTAFHGVMSAGKDLIIATSNDGGGGYDLIVLCKAGETFSSADLQGTWNIDVLTSGGGSNWIGWAYGTAMIGNNGNITWISMTRSDGNSSLPNGSATLSINPNGVVASSGIPTLHGSMSLNKKAMYTTMNDGGGGYNLMIFTKVN